MYARYFYIAILTYFCSNITHPRNVTNGNIPLNQMDSSVGGKHMIKHTKHVSQFATVAAIVGLFAMLAMTLTMTQVAFAASSGLTGYASTASNIATATDANTNANSNANTTTDAANTAGYTTTDSGATATNTMDANAAASSSASSGYASSGASAGTATMTDVHMTSFSNFMSDVGYHIRSAFTFGAQARLNLIAQRNEQLRERQEQWISLHDRIVANDNLTAAQKQQALVVIQDHNSGIIQAHNDLVANVQQISQDANASGNSDIYVRSTNEEQSQNMSGNSDASVRTDVDLSVDSKILG